MDVVVTVPTSPDPIDNIFPYPLDAFHVSSLCSLPSPSLSVTICHLLSIGSGLVGIVTTTSTYDLPKKPHQDHAPRLKYCLTHKNYRPHQH